MRADRFLIQAILALLLASLIPAPIFADGIIIPEPSPHIHPAPVPNLVIKYHRVNVIIEDRIATTRVDQVFYNPYEFEVEGTYIFPIPEEAAISEFSMYVDGKKLEGKLLDKDEARRIYEEIVRKRRDPALLEYVGRNAFQARIFPIPPNGERRIQLEYTQILPYESGLIKYVYPLDTERFSAEPIEEVSVRVEIHSRAPIKAVYSPSHKVDIQREDEYTAVVGYEATDILPDKDFALYYSVSPEEVGLSLLSYKPAGEDGFFLLLMAPQVEVEEQEAVAKDVIFVLDVSGSMEGEKLRQAKAALEFVLKRLNPEDRFNVLAFSTGVRRFAPSLRPASERDEALKFTRKLQARGSTNIYQALLEALSDVEDRPTYLLFLTDGLPTVGVTDVERIVQEVGQKVPENVRLFTFGVGDDVNTFLLDRLSSEHRGTSVYVRPGEDIEAAVSAFYSRISYPVLTDIAIDWGGIRVEDVHPYPLPDLFAGMQLVVVGRYREGGKTRIVLSGKVGEEEKRFVYEDVEFVEKGGEDFIARLWATRRIGYLMEQIRLHGEDKELVNEIVELSLRYGIITPYTSFLVEEDLSTAESPAPIVTRVAERIFLAPMAAVGADAVQKSVVQKELAESNVAAGPSMAEVKHVGDKTFILRDGVWTDTTFDKGKMKPVEVAFGSEEYFRLLAEHPEWGQYLALGKRVIFVGGDVAYEITEGSGRVEKPASAITPEPSPKPGSEPTPTPGTLPWPLRWLKQILSWLGK